MACFVGKLYDIRSLMARPRQIAIYVLEHLHHSIADIFAVVTFRNVQFAAKNRFKQNLLCRNYALIRAMIAGVELAQQFEKWEFAIPFPCCIFIARKDIFGCQAENLRRAIEDFLRNNAFCNKRNRLRIPIFIHLKEKLIVVQKITRKAVLQEGIDLGIFMILIF